MITVGSAGIASVVWDAFRSENPSPYQLAKFSPIASSATAVPAAKYGTPSPVPFRVVDARANLDVDISLRCFGEYSYHISNPILFYTNVCGNVTDEYTRDRLDSQLKTELLTALQPALAQISAKGVQYYEIPAHTFDIRDALNEVLAKEWGEKRGLAVFSFNVNSLTIPEEQKKKITEWEENAMTMNPNVGAARYVGNDCFYSR